MRVYIRQDRLISYFINQLRSIGTGMWKVKQNDEVYFRIKNYTKKSIIKLERMNAVVTVEAYYAPGHYDKIKLRIRRGSSAPESVQELQLPECYAETVKHFSTFYLSR